MNLNDLSQHAHAGDIDALNLISIEGGIYLLKRTWVGAPIRSVIAKVKPCTCARSSMLAVCCRTCRACRFI